MVGDAEGGHRPLQLHDPVAAQLVGPVGGEAGELGDEDLPLLPQRAGEQGDVGALGDVAGHGRPVVDRLVVGVGVHEQEATIGVDHVPMVPRPGPGGHRAPVGHRTLVAAA